MWARIILGGLPFLIFLAPTLANNEDENASLNTIPRVLPQPGRIPATAGASVLVRGFSDFSTQVLETEAIQFNDLLEGITVSVGPLEVQQGPDSGLDLDSDTELDAISSIQTGLSPELSLDQEDLGSMEMPLDFEIPIPPTTSREQISPALEKEPKPRTAIKVPCPGPSVPSLAELLIPSPSSSRTSTLSPGEAANICKTSSWALTPENWIFSGAKNFLDAYTVATNGDYERKQYGLIGSLAHHYLGEENFRCSIGMMQTCVVSCKDIVMAVEDLEEARLVYFILTSVSHFAAVTDLVHVSSPSFICFYTFL